MNHLTLITQAEQRISALEALRGTPDEPPALDAQIGQYKRTRAWHSVRLNQDHPNVGSSSLYACTGRSKRAVQRFNRITEHPLPTLALA